MAYSQSISRDDFRARLEDASKRAIVPVEGIFGPESLTWRFLRESVGFLGGGRAALLQTAHPWVANGVDQHSKTKTDPAGRFQRTFEGVFTILFGSLDQVTTVSEHLNRTHGKIVGKVPDATGAFAAGSKYYANQVDAMMWVHATLWETYMTMYELVVGPVDLPTKEAFYQEIKRFALCFGVPYEAQPPTWNDFIEYNVKMWDSPYLGVGDAARDLRRFLFRFNLVPGGQQVFDFVELFTAFNMPPRLRDEYRMSRPTTRNRIVYQTGLATMRVVYPRLPERVRFMPAYFEALDRISGKERSSDFTRKMSKIFVGREELVARNAWLVQT